MTSARSLSLALSAFAILLVSPVTSLAQANANQVSGHAPVRVTEKRITLSSVSRGRVCGSPLSTAQNAPSKNNAQNKSTTSDVCFPEMPLIAQSMGAATDLVASSATTCAKETNGTWNCWGLPTLRLKAVVDKLVAETAKDQKPFALGDNLCTITVANKVICTTYTTYSQGDLEATNSKSTSEKIQRFGPFKDLKAVGGSKSFLCVIDGERIKCQSTGMYEINFAADISHPRLIAATSFSICVVDDKGFRCFGNSTVEKLNPHPDWKDAKVIRASDQGVCVVRASNKLECETDIGKNADQFQIPNDLGPVSDFGIGVSHMCALTTQGAVRCWGMDIYEGLLDVPKFNSKVKQLSLGEAHSCALLESGAVKCWGRAADPQIQVPRGTNSKFKVASGTSFSCLYSTTGVRCDGESYGVGAPPWMRQILSVSVPSNSGNDACAIEQILSPVNNSRVMETVAKCWGLTDAINAVPQTLQNPKLVSVSSNYACAATDSNITCWGSIPSMLEGYPDRIEKPRKLVTADKHACVTDNFGLACWGELQPEAEPALDLRVPAQYEGRGATLDVAVGNRHTCILTSTREVHCWGDNAFGQLNVPALDNPVSIGAAENMTCATDSKGVICWGEEFSPSDSTSTSNSSPGSSYQPRLPFPGGSGRLPNLIGP